MRMSEGRSRVVIEDVVPQIDGGRFPIKRVVGEHVDVYATAFTDGHDAVSAVLRYRQQGAETWQEVIMEPANSGLDRWGARFSAEQLGRMQYVVRAWVDRYKTWSRDLAKRVQAGQNVTVDLQIGAALVEEAFAGAGPLEASTLRTIADAMQAGTAEGIRLALDGATQSLMFRYAPRHYATDTDPLEVIVDPVRARYGAWYEFFPRSTGANGAHGTFRDAEAMLPYIADLGFQVVYLPPIHPIGMQFRKGKNNSTTALDGDVGSPWAIGGAEGGHKDIHPDLGTLQDFHRFRDAAASHGLELALDIAFQASPDHPYVKDHRVWFRERPDGTIQYAENPPKKYQDIYPFDFETTDWRAMWEELKSVFEYWISQGVTIFRVDNPHTKAFGFWEWCIEEIKRDHPEAIFLAEAFTRPTVLYRLAKLGYTQSYNYFPWRNTKAEITEFFEEVSRPPISDFFRPSIWPNTPDILTEYLQQTGRNGFIVRIVLAATLGATYGIYGPAYEMSENEPMAPGKEEYLNSEKYELKRWDLHAYGSLRYIIKRLNEIRRDNPALQTNATVRFHPIENDQIVAYTKQSEDGSNLVLTVVNIDAFNTQSGWVGLPLEELGLDPNRPFTVTDMLNGERYNWKGAYNYVELHPGSKPAHVFIISQ